MWITRHDAMLGELGRRDIVQVRLRREGKNVSRRSRGISITAAPSSDVDIHRAIYHTTDAAAVVHAHPPRATALSLAMNEIVPRDIEGKYHLVRVPVVGENTVESYRNSAGMLAEALRSRRIALMRGHGAYACGETLESALHWISTLEFSAEVLRLRSAKEET